MDLETYSRISTQVFASAINQKNWDNALAEMSVAFPSLHMFLFTQDTINQMASMNSTSGFDPDFISSFTEYYSGISPWGPALSAQAPGTCSLANEIFPEDQLRKTEFYADWILPQEDLIGGGGGVLARSSTTSAVFGANMRHSEREALEPSWMAFAGNILPAMTQAWNINRAMAAAEIDKMLPAHARRNEAAIVVLRPDGYPAYVNETAEDLIETGHSLQQDYTGRIWISGSAMAN